MTARMRGDAGGLIRRLTALFFCLLNPDETVPISILWVFGYPTTTYHRFTPFWLLARFLPFII